MFASLKTEYPSIMIIYERMKVRTMKRSVFLSIYLYSYLWEIYLRSEKYENR